MKVAGFSKKDYTNEAFLRSSFSYISSGAIDKINYPYCYKMCTALKDPFDCWIGSGKLENTWGFIVNRNVQQSFDSIDRDVLVHFIDAESNWGKLVKVLLNGRDFIETDMVGNLEKYRMNLPQNHQELTNQELSIHIEVFLERLFFAEGLSGSILTDKRIVKALEYVNHNLQMKIGLKQVAEHIHLSPDRFRHLFIEQTGMPFSQFVLWKRIRMVVGVVSREKLPVSKVCMQFGFTDYSHFSRVFKGIFGVAPNILFRYCRVVSDPRSGSKY